MLCTILILGTIFTSHARIPSLVTSIMMWYSFSNVNFMIASEVMDVKDYDSSRVFRASSIGLASNSPFCCHVSMKGYCQKDIWLKNVQTELIRRTRPRIVAVAELVSAVV